MSEKRVPVEHDSITAHHEGALLRPAEPEGDVLVNTCVGEVFTEREKFSHKIYYRVSSLACDKTTNNVFQEP